jgi:hypothetical protein
MLSPGLAEERSGWERVRRAPPPSRVEIPATFAAPWTNPVNIGNEKGPFQAPRVLVLLAVLGSLGAFFGLELGADRRTFFFFDLLHAEFLAFVFLDGVTDFVFDFFRSLLEFFLGLAESAGELGELGASEEKQDDEEHNPDDWAVEYGEGEIHGQIAVAVIEGESNISISLGYVNPCLPS